MATVLCVTFEVPDSVDPTREDPQEAAEELLALHEVEARTQGAPRFFTGVLEASWTTV